jgi:hypothetical protein
MSYLFSLLKDKSPDQLPSQVDSSILCYYINDTADTQIIRMVSESLCHFERIVFSSERLLFKAFLESHLEIHSPFPDGVRITRSECRSLQVNKK